MEGVRCSPALPSAPRTLPDRSAKTGSAGDASLSAPRGAAAATAARICSASTATASLSGSFTISGEDNRRPRARLESPPMPRFLRLLAVPLAAASAIALSTDQSARAPEPGKSLVLPGEEKFLANVRQLTFGGQNAEAYWSADGKRIIFQSNDEGRLPCDQIFVMNADGSGKQRISNGKGKTTCA